jgi:hypothetical protein
MEGASKAEVSETGRSELGVHLETNGEPWGPEQPRMGPHRHVDVEASKPSMR